MKVSLVIVNYNTKNLLQQCLNHLNSIKNMFLSEIIVVDNASSDGSAQWLQATNDECITKIISERNIGFAAGCNLGIRKATGEAILLLNTDAFPQPGALDILVDYLYRHPDVGIVGSQLLFADGHWQSSGGFIPSPRSAMLNALGLTSAFHSVSSFYYRLFKRTVPYAPEYVDGACMLIRRELLDEIGLLDERFFFFAEDAEFCDRARQRGWKVRLVPESHVVHLRGSSSSKKDFEKSARMQADSLKRFVMMRYGLDGWKRFCFWMRVNFGWRYGMTVLFSRDQNRRSRYQAAWQLYKQELR